MFHFQSVGSRFPTRAGLFLGFAGNV